LPASICIRLLLLAAGRVGEGACLISAVDPAAFSGLPEFAGVHVRSVRSSRRLLFLNQPSSGPILLSVCFERSD